MKTRKIKAVLSIILAAVMLLPMLVSCGADEPEDYLVFGSEAEMVEYVKGTFVGDKYICVFDDDKVYKIDADELFPTDEASVEKLYNAIYGDTDSYNNKVTLERYYEINGFEPSAADVSYNYERGELTFEGNTYKLDLDGNLIMDTGTLEWKYADTTFYTDCFGERFNEVMELINEKFGAANTDKVKYTHTDVINGMDSLLPDYAGCDVGDATPGTAEGVYSWTGSCLDGAVVFTVGEEDGAVNVVMLITPLSNVNTGELLYKTEEEIAGAISTTVNLAIAFLPSTLQENVKNNIYANAKYSGSNMSSSYTYGDWMIKLEVNSTFVTVTVEYDH